MGSQGRVMAGVRAYLFLTWVAVMAMVVPGKDVIELGENVKQLSSDSIDPECGDGNRGALEQCDDGNRLDGDGCSRECGVEPGYSCTGGDSLNSDTCTTICGDGRRVAEEGCDDG